MEFGIVLLIMLGAFFGWLIARPNTDQLRRDNELRELQNKHNRAK